MLSLKAIVCGYCCCCCVAGVCGVVVVNDVIVIGTAVAVCRY